MILVVVELVGGQGVDHQPGAQPPHAVIEIEDDFGAGMELGGELGCFQIGIAVMERIKPKQGIAPNSERLAGVVSQTEPAHVAFVTVFLGHDVRRVLVTDGAVIGAYQATGIAVAVVFVGTTTIPTQRFKGGVELQGKPDAG